MPQKRREAVIVIKNSRLRSFLGKFVPFVLIPVTVLLAALLGKEKHYWLAILAVAVLALVYFVSDFEKKKTGSRRMVIVSVMASLCVIGRLIPYFKPVAALCVLTGMYFGTGAGFLCGALAALVSNFFFGHGPWTPFQMVAWGFLGVLAAVFRVPLQKKRWALIAFGALGGVFFSLVMDLWVALWSSETLNASLYSAALVTSVPHTLLYSLSNGLFLFFLAKPFGEKFRRIKEKYGV